MLNRSSRMWPTPVDRHRVYGECAFWILFAFVNVMICSRIDDDARSYPGEGRFNRNSVLNFDLRVIQTAHIAVREHAHKFASELRSADH